MSNDMDLDQDRGSLGPDLDPNFSKCYQKMKKVAASRERVNKDISARMKVQNLQNPDFFKLKTCSMLKNNNNFKFEYKLSQV